MNTHRKRQLRRISRAVLLLGSFLFCLLMVVSAIRTARAAGSGSEPRAQNENERAQPAAATASTPKQLASAASSGEKPGRGRGGPGAKKGEAPAAAPAPATPPLQQRVAVGVYVHHVNQVDLRANTFLADIYVWFRWKGEIDPTKTFELRNAVEQWQIVKVPTYLDAEGQPSPVVLEDGSKYQIFRIEARFGRPFTVQHYPLDEQDLLIEVEESSASSQELLYEVDSPAAGIDGRIVIPGWEVQSSKAIADSAFFATNFGDPRVKPGEIYTRMTMTVHIVRPTRGMIVKTIVPLAIVILITFGVFLLSPDLVDARLSLSVTALISAIALHFSVSTELPEVGYLVLLDKVYILSYVVILATTAASIAAGRLAENSTDRAKRFDTWVGVLCTVLFFGGTGAILIWR